MAEKEFVFKINGQQAANTIAGIQKQIKALDDTIANSNIHDPGFNNLVKESEKAKNSLKTLQTDGIGGLKPQGLIGQVKGFGKSLAEIPGPIGGVVGGINSMTAASLRFIATPVGAIIAALVLVFKAFQKGIESSEKAQQGLNKIMGAFNGIIGPVIKVVGEFAAILIDGVVAAIDATMSALEALGFDFAKTAKDGMALAGTLNEIEEAEGDLEVARAQQNKTLAEAKELLSDTNAKYEDRKKALDEIRIAEEKLAAQEVELAKRQVAAAEENIRLYGASKEANDKLDAARIKLANTEEAFASKKRQFNKEEKKLNAEVETAAKEKAAADEARRKEDLAKYKANIDAKNKYREETTKISLENDLRNIKDERQRALQDNANRIAELKKAAEEQIKDKKLYAARSAEIAEKERLDIYDINKKYDDLEIQQAKDVRAFILSEQEASQEKEIQALEDYTKKLLEIEAARVARETEAAKGDVEALNAIVSNKEGIEEASAKKKQAINDKYAKQKIDKDIADIQRGNQENIVAIENGLQIELDIIDEQFAKKEISRKEANQRVIAAQKAHDEELRQEELNTLQKIYQGYGDAIDAKIEKNKEERIAFKKGLDEGLINQEEYDMAILELDTKLSTDKQGQTDAQLQAEKDYQGKVNEYRQKDVADEEAASKKKADLRKQQFDATLQTAQDVITALQDLQELANLEENNREEERRKTEYDSAIAAAKATSDAALAVEGVTAEQKKKIKFDYDNAVADADFKRATEEYNLAKTQFDNGKKLQIASAIISTIQSAVSAFASLAVIPVVGPVLGGIAAAAALVSGYAQVEMIKKTQYSGKAPVRTEVAAPDAGGAGGGGSKRAQGGLLTGRRHSEGGIPTSLGELEGGEYVVNRQATESFLPLLEQINGMGKGSGAPNNLSVAGEQYGINTQTPIIKTYVVASDMSSQQEANKRLEDIARL
jgi:hypothetical protein